MSPRFHFSLSLLLKSLRSRLLSEIHRLPQKPTVKQELKITRMRSRLEKQVKDFLYGANIFLPNLQEGDLKPIDEDLIDTLTEETKEPDDLGDGLLNKELYGEEKDNDEASSDLPETVILPLPSNIISGQLGPFLESLRSIERELRRGQANDVLEGVRIGLANKSLLLLTDVNKSTSTKAQAKHSSLGECSKCPEPNSASCICLPTGLESTQMHWDCRGSGYLSETGSKGSCYSQGHHICQKVWTRK